MDGASWPEARVTVAVGGLARLVRLGLIGILRTDPGVRLLKAVDETGLEGVVAHGSVQVVVLGEPAAQSVLSLRAVELDLGFVVLARKPTLTYGMALVGCGISCLDWDACSGDIRAAIYLAACGGCMFVSGDDRVEYQDWRADGLLTKRQRVVLAHHMSGDSYEEIALALKISISTVKKHTASLCCKLKVASKRDLSKILILAHA
jgi:DNA-binding NarL/FixJ family response regulator